MTRRDTGGYVVAMRGPLFDASPWMDTFLSMSGSDGGDDEPADDTTLQISLDADRIRRLAAYMARLPKGCLGAAPSVVRHRGKPLPDLREDLFALEELADPAFEAFNTS